MKTKTEEIKKRKTFCFWCNKEASVKKYKRRYVCPSCHIFLTNRFG